MRTSTGRSAGVFLVIVAAAILAATSSEAQQTRPAAKTIRFIPPPHSIIDIAELLDKEKPDPKKRAQDEAAADAEPGKAVKGDALGKFYFERAKARAALGRAQDAIADCEKAVPLIADYTEEGSRVENFMEIQLRLAGDFRRAIDVLNGLGRKLDIEGHGKGRAFYIYNRLAYNYVLLGDLQRAEAYQRKFEAWMAQARSWPNVQQFVSVFEANFEEARGFIASARGRHSEAEVAFHKASVSYADAMQRSKSWPHPTPQSTFLYAVDMMTLAEGRSKLRQGRLAEGEIDIRRALLNRLKNVGKYHADVAQMLFVLAEVMDEQGRHGDAEDLARRSIEIYRSIGYRADGQFYVAALNRVATNLYLQGRFREAKDAFSDFNQASEGWTPARIEKTRSSWAWIFLHYYTQEVDRGVELARATLAYEKAVKASDTSIRRWRGRCWRRGSVWLGATSRRPKNSRSSIPILLTSSRESEDEDAAFTVASDLRLRQVVEANIELLARAPDKQAAAAESLRLADAIRARSVQNALAASSARTAARTPALADLARKGQDLTKQVSALTSLVGDVLSQPADQRDEKAIKQLQADLEKARNERSAAKREIDRRFPEYANLVRPLPVTAEDIRTALRPEEALLSFYFGTRSSFVWAVRKDGPIAFAALPTTAGDMEKKVKLAPRGLLSPTPRPSAPYRPSTLRPRTTSTNFCCSR